MAEASLQSNAVAVLNAIRRTFGFTDDQLGDLCGLSGSAIQAKRVGRVRLNLDDIEAVSEGLDIPPSTFFMSPGEAIRWMIDHPGPKHHLKYYVPSDAA
jgi:transcriptional regulator with XRE-family HTH domain